MANHCCYMLYNVLNLTLQLEVIFKQQLTKNDWCQLFKYEYLLTFGDSKLNSFRFQQLVRQNKSSEYVKFGFRK